MDGQQYQVTPTVETHLIRYLRARFMDSDDAAVYSMTERMSEEGIETQCFDFIARMTTKEAEEFIKAETAHERN